MIIFTQYYLDSLMVKNSSRLVSLDIFRGLTVAFMIVVDAPGSRDYVYSPLQYSKWHGCTLTDLVFPFFLFIVGISTYYSFKKFGNEINGGSIFRIIRRMATIFAVGLFLNIFPYFERDYSTLRIMGVLQRIALAYGLGAIICLTVRREYLWIVIAVLLLLYWGLLAFFGGADPYNLESNFALKADVAIFGKNHLYKGLGVPFDPEGLFSTITAVCTVVIGYFTGEMIGKDSANGKTVLKLALLGTSAIGLGYLWNILLPINKLLWTSSYVLYTAGIAMVVMAIIYMISDVLKFRKWATFFIVFGTNAFFAYILASILTKLLLLIQIPSENEKISLYGWFYEKVCVPIAGNFNGSLMFAMIKMLLIWVAALILYRKKILIRL
jgi:predicted acyltransferase